jgi:hypothetical protein
MQFGEILGERREPGMAQAPLRPVDEQGRADLDDDAAELVEGRQVHGRTGLRMGRIMPAAVPWPNCRRCKAARAQCRCAGRGVLYSGAVTTRAVQQS